MVIDPFVPHWQVLPAWEATPIVTAIEPWLLPIWCIGALLFCSKVLLGLIALFRIERTSTELASDPWSTLVSECRQDLGIHKPVRLLHFPGRIMPMTWGVLRNFVVLPSSAARWSAQRVRAVLMHELAHIRRGDYVASLLRDAVCAFYWFHPLVWWAAKEMDEDREEASDDAVGELVRIVTADVNPLHRGGRITAVEPVEYTLGTQPVAISLVVPFL